MYHSYEEIAEMMKISAGTVKSRVHNGLITVRRELEMDEETESHHFTRTTK